MQSKGVWDEPETWLSRLDCYLWISIRFLSTNLSFKRTFIFTHFPGKQTKKGPEFKKIIRRERERERTYGHGRFDGRFCTLWLRRERRNPYPKMTLLQQKIWFQTQIRKMKSERERGRAARMFERRERRNRLRRSLYCEGRVIWNGNFAKVYRDKFGEYKIYFKCISHEKQINKINFFEDCSHFISFCNGLVSRLEEITHRPLGSGENSHWPFNVTCSVFTMTWFTFEWD